LANRASFWSLKIGALPKHASPRAGSIQGGSVRETPWIGGDFSLKTQLKSALGAAGEDRERGRGMHFVYKEDYAD